MFKVKINFVSLSPTHPVLELKRDSNSVPGQVKKTMAQLTDCSELRQMLTEQQMNSHVEKDTIEN